MMTRLEANQKILKIIQKVVNNYPDLRFGQILWKLGILEHKYKKPTKMDECNYEVRDPFYDEPVEILKRIKDDLT